MSISNFSTRAELVGTGAQVAFTAPFEVFADTDLVVNVNGVKQTLTTHYTVSNIGADTTIVTFLVAPANGASVVIYRAVTAERQTDYSQFGALKAANFNTEFDKIIAMIQELQTSGSLVLQFDPSQPVPASALLPTPTADKFLRWNPAGTALINDTVISAGTVSTATTSSQGISELATDAETIAKSDTTRNITPSNLAALDATTSFKGFVQLAAQADIDTGTNTTKAVTPQLFADNASNDLLNWNNFI